SHPRKNELLQALGVAKVLQPDVSLVPLNVYRDDTFLLCSDGLSGMLNDDEILETSKNLDPIDASNALCRAANKNGGLDNVTVRLLRSRRGKFRFKEIGKPHRRFDGTIQCSTSGCSYICKYRLCKSKQEVQKILSFDDNIICCNIVQRAALFFHSFGKKKAMRISNRNRILILPLMIHLFKIRETQV
ncbi:MAG: hypothetical protein IPG02_17165, partial [Ignavibacteria bacterium]|nr:hypothetical protein [Ignavibacteria bacterium]